MKTDVVIIGGGPAGLMAAYQLHVANIDYVLLEKNSLLGKKLLITGQGRCNVTNHLNTNQFITQLSIPHRKFLYSSLSAFGTSEVVAFFEERNTPLYQDGELKYFPKSNKAVDIRDVFTDVISNNVKLNTEVKSIKKKEYFEVKTNRQTFHAKYVIVATGSKSFPKTGSTGKGLDLAESFGIKKRDFYPAETSVYSSFVSKHKEQLQGIAIPQSEVRIKNTKITSKGDLLFTHFGLSGPSIFHLSEDVYHQIKNGNNILELKLAKTSEKAFLNALESADPKLRVVRLLEQHTVKRLARFIVEQLQLDNVQIGTVSQKVKRQIVEHLFRFNIVIDRVEELDKAYVNGGGILTTELHPKSFESKHIEGLYFIGETVDVHGPIGGFNITIAFSSGVAASSHIIGRT